MKTIMCYCGKPEIFEQCCKPILNGLKAANSAESLMRSRFSAYCIKDIDYIYKTYAPAMRLNNSKSDISLFAEQANFANLTIYHVEQDDIKGLAKVHFKADYFIGDLFCQLEEISNFVKEQGKWFYTDGKILPHDDYKVARNEKCPCGSNIKFKHCHAC